MEAHILQIELTDSLLWIVDEVPDWPGSSELIDAIKVANDWLDAGFKWASPPIGWSASNSIRIDYPLEIQRRAKKLGVDLYKKFPRTQPSPYDFKKDSKREKKITDSMNYLQYNV